MDIQKQLTLIRTKDDVIDTYINQFSPDEYAQLILELPKKIKGFSRIIKNTKLDTIHLTVLAEALYHNRKVDLSNLKHSRAEKLDFQQADELLQLIKEYSAEKIAISSVRFDFKKLYDKSGNRKSNKDVKDSSASSIRVTGKQVLGRLMISLEQDTFKEILAVYESYLKFPVFESENNPKRKAEFVRKHNRIATNAIMHFLGTNKDIPIKERKIITMNALVLMTFLDSHEEYKKQAKAKRTKRVLARSEYLLQRYNEFARSR